MDRGLSGAYMFSNDRYGYSQTLPLKWLQAPQERDRASLLEFVRGTLYSLSRREDGRFEAVHVSRIQRTFNRLGVPSLYKVGLRLLELLREVESLFGGYWLPTPFRVVEIKGELVFIGAIPDAHGLLGDARNEGLSRLLAREVADRFPRQSLECWMGVPPQNPSTIVAALIEKHKRTSAKTSGIPEVEYLSLAPGSAGRRGQLRWSETGISALSAEQIAICRQWHRNRPRYFSASLHGGRIATEAPINTAIQRLLFAVARHAGAPIRAVIRPGRHGTEVTVSERLPIEEFRLSVLLSREIVRAGRSTTFILPPNLASAFSARLAALGCALESMQ